VVLAAQQDNLRAQLAQLEKTKGELERDIDKHAIKAATLMNEAEAEQPGERPGAVARKRGKLADRENVSPSKNCPALFAFACCLYMLHK